MPAFHIRPQKAMGCFHDEFGYVQKAEKIQQMCEELRGVGTKAMKERGEKKGRNEGCSKVKHSSLTNTRRHTCLRKLQHEQTKQKQ